MTDELLRDDDDGPWKAVLGDDRPHWKPTSFGYAHFGCEVRLQFLSIKLFEFDRQMLDNTATVMAAFVQAHLSMILVAGRHPQE